MMLDLLLAAGIVMTSATQLRLPGIPIGPGELGLLLWIGLTSVYLMLRGASPQMPALARLATFWGVFALALSIGAFFGVLLDARLSLVRMTYDTVAYFLVGVLTCLSVATADTVARFQRTAWAITGLSTVGILVQFAAGFGLLHLPTVEPWYWDRFRGWSENPNQVAVTSCVGCLLALHLATTTRGFARVFALAAAMLAFIAGRLSKSDTFISVMIMTGALLLALRLRRWLLAPEYKSRLRHGIALLLIIGAVPTALSVAPYVVAKVGAVEHLALALSKDKGGEATEGTVSLRLLLWDEALALGIKSGSFGLGPGPHLEPPSELLMADKPFEAHSTPLDIFLQGGVLALLAFAALLASAIMLAYRARLDILLAMLFAVSIFSTAHFVLRQPIIWFVLALCISLGCADRERRRAVMVR